MPDILASWAHRERPLDLPGLLKHLDRVAGPKLAVIGEGPIWPSRISPAELLWDEVARTCDWLQFHGYYEAPIRPPKTSDPAESQRYYWEVRTWICTELASEPSG